MTNSKNLIATANGFNLLLGTALTFSLITTAGADFSVRGSHGDVRAFVACATGRGMTVVREVYRDGAMVYGIASFTMA